MVLGIKTGYICVYANGAVFVRNGAIIGSAVHKRERGKDGQRHKQNRDFKSIHFPSYQVKCPKSRLLGTILAG